MRILLVLLIVLNAVLFLAASQRPTPLPSATDINPEGLRLLGEADVVPTPSDSRLCLQIGPFADAESQQATQTRLADANIQAQPFGGQTLSYRTLEVYLGPFNTPDDAQVTLNQLQALNVQYELTEIDNGLIFLSFGFFTQASLAEQFVRYYAAHGITLQTRTEYRPLQAGHWLEVEKTEEAEAKVLEVLPEVGRGEGRCGVIDN